MPYKVLFHKDCLKRDFKGIPKNINARIIKAIEERLVHDPMQYGIRLRKSLAGFWKIRVGDYRVIFNVSSGIGIVDIITISHRKNAYKIAERRASSISD